MSSSTQPALGYLLWSACSDGERLRQRRRVFLSHVNDPATTSLFPGDPEFMLDTVATVPADGFYMHGRRGALGTDTFGADPGVDDTFAVSTLLFHHTGSAWRT